MTSGGRSPHPNALPNYQNAVIPREKIEGYLLNPTHPVGGNKAVVFKSALGLDKRDWELLAKAILDQLPYYEAVLGKKDIFGQRYNVTFPITGPNGNTVDVLTAWIVEIGKDYPSFITAVVQ